MKITALLLAAIVVPTRAALVVTNHQSSGAYTVATDDALTGLVPVVTGTPILNDYWEPFTTSNPVVLTDGVFGSANPNQDIPPLNSPTTLTIESGNTTLTYTLANSGPGLTIASIESYGGWQDPGRDAQRFSVSYATVASPFVFLPLATVDFNPSSATLPSNTRVSITDDLDGVLAEGVGALRFTFSSNQESGYAGYREIDVFTAVPEPSTSLLAILGLFPLLSRRRKASFE